VSGLLDQKTASTYDLLQQQQQTTTTGKTKLAKNIISSNTRNKTTTISATV
jgi:CRISPR/Cas system-associated endonuclease Cas1